MMEKDLDGNQEKWHSLLEEKGFDELIEVERVFVLSFGSKAQFDIERRALEEMRAEDNVLVPRALILEEEKRGFIAPIPLYQTLIAVAAAFLIGFILIRPGDTMMDTNANAELAKVDTVYLDKIQKDTIIKFEKEFVDRVVYVESETVVASLPSQTANQSGILSSNVTALPSLESMKLNNTGSSANDDETLFLVENFSLMD
ncbi:MAG: hypothetical protein ACI865_003414 [Flavobacteriaceae bacterium]|jgi:hypothetical protein